MGQEMERVEKDVGRSRKGAGREEGERLFGSLLVDQVKDHEVSWLCTRHLPGNFLHKGMGHVQDRYEKGRD